jgi:hypothetical protein
VDLWLFSRMSVQEEFSEHLSMRFREGTISEGAFDAFMESSSKEEFSLAAVWKSDGEAAAAAKNTGRREQLKCYRIKGQPEAVFGVTLCLGRYFFQDEEAACLLDQKAAQCLFGTEDAVGNIVELGGKKYQVAGILSGSRMVCATQADQGAAFDGIAVCRVSSKQSVKNSIKTLEMYFGNADEVIDGQFYFSSAYILFALNLAVTWFMICFLIGFSASRPVKILFLVTGGVFAVLILIMGIRFSGLGREYLPTYWSDFEFYENLWREKADAVRQLSRHQEFWQEQLIWTRWLQAVIGNLVLIGVQILTVYVTIDITRSMQLHTRKGMHRKRRNEDGSKA